jgi:hypothetical protein
MNGGGETQHAWAVGDYNGACAIEGAIEGSSMPTSKLCDIANGVKDGSPEPLDRVMSALAGGASPNETCPWTGRGALMLCAQRGWTRCVAALLEAGADPGMRDAHGRDALMLALIAREVECAKALAPVSRSRMRDAKGRCALALAALHAPHRADAALMRMLWTPGADRWADCEGKTAMDYAREGGMDSVDFKGFKRAAVEARALGRARSSKRGARPLARSL